MDPAKLAAAAKRVCCFRNLSNRCHCCHDSRAAQSTMIGCVQRLPRPSYRSLPFRCILVRQHWGQCAVGIVVSLQRSIVSPVSFSNPRVTTRKAKSSCSFAPPHHRVEMGGGLPPAPAIHPATSGRVDRFTSIP